MGLHALAGLPYRAGLVPMDPAEVPTSWSRADAPRATTSQLFSIHPGACLTATPVTAHRWLIAAPPIAALARLLLRGHLRLSLVA